MDASDSSISRDSLGGMALARRYGCFSLSTLILSTILAGASEAYRGGFTTACTAGLERNARYTSKGAPHSLDVNLFFYTVCGSL